MPHASYDYIHDVLENHVKFWLLWMVMAQKNPFRTLLDYGKQKEIGWSMGFKQWSVFFFEIQVMNWDINQLEHQDPSPI